MKLCFVECEEEISGFEDDVARNPEGGRWNAHFTSTVINARQRVHEVSCSSTYSIDLKGRAYRKYSVLPIGYN